MQSIQRSGRNTGYDGAKADVWSAGVLLYVTLTAQFPFDSGEAENYDQLTYNVWHKQVWGIVGIQAYSLLLNFSLMNITIDILACQISCIVFVHNSTKETGASRGTMKRLPNI